MKRTHRKKELTEVQELRLENKALRTENRTLKKQLKRLERKEHSFEETRYEDPEEKFKDPLFQEQKQRCPECTKGELVFMNVVGRTWTECSQCDYRTKTIRIGLKDD